MKAEELLMRDATEAVNLEVVTVPPELPVQAAHRIMLDRALRHLPVVLGAKLAGIVSERELLLVISKARDGSFVYPRLTVGEVMTLVHVAVTPAASITEIARLMVDAKLDAIPILTSQNVLVGLVTSNDLMRSVADLRQSAPPALSFQIRRAAELQASA
jgi:acetoin utilization protein AcuB